MSTKEPCSTTDALIPARMKRIATPSAGDILRTTRAPNFYTAQKFGSKLPFYRPRSGRSNFSGFLSALLPPSRIFYMRTSLTSGVPGNGHLCSSRARRAPMPRSAGGSTRAAGWRAVAGSRCPRVIFSVCLSALLPSRLNYSDYLSTFLPRARSNCRV